MLKVKDFLKMVGQNLLPSYKVIYDFLDGCEEDEKWIFTDLGEVVEELFGECYIASFDSIYLDYKKEKDEFTFVLYIQKEQDKPDENKEDIEPNF